MDGDHDSEVDVDETSRLMETLHVEFQPSPLGESSEPSRPTQKRRPPDYGTQVRFDFYHVYI